jgi:hypothetical protein
MFNRRVLSAVFVAIAVPVFFVFLAEGSPFAIAAAQSSSAPGAVEQRQFSGWYGIVSTAESGSQFRVALRITLFNHGQNDLCIEHAALDFRNPVEGTQKSLIGICVDHASSQTVTDEFVLPRAALERLQRAPLKLVLDTITEAGERHSETIVLDHRSTGEEK